MFRLFCRSRGSVIPERYKSMATTGLWSNFFFRELTILSIQGDHIRSIRSSSWKNILRTFFFCRTASIVGALTVFLMGRLYMRLKLIDYWSLSYKFGDEDWDDETKCYPKAHHTCTISRHVVPQFSEFFRYWLLFLHLEVVHGIPLSPIAMRCFFIERLPAKIRLDGCIVGPEWVVHRKISKEIWSQYILLTQTCIVLSVR